MLNGFGSPEEIEGLRRDLPGSAYHPADMSKPAEIAALISETERLFGAVDILVNNAGIQHVAPIESFPAEKWDQVLAINLSSSFHTIRAALPGMRRRAWGASSTSPRRTGWSPPPKKPPTWRPNTA